MRLSERIPSETRTLGNSGVLNMLWMAGSAFVLLVGALLLLQRLGLPMPYVLGLTATLTMMMVVMLGWAGRTMTSTIFFFGNRQIEPSPLGIGGTSDWMCGAFLVLFFTAPLAGKLMLAPALMIGMLLQAALFAGAFQRSGVLTVPGFFAWRGNSASNGYIALIVVVTIMTLLILAEFQIALGLMLQLGQLDSQITAVILLVLIVFPSLCGGWMGLILVNAALAIWMLVAILLPAFVTGFFPSVLQAGLELDRDGRSLALLELTSSPFVQPGEFFSSTPTVIVALFTLAAGFAVLPHALSRRALNGRQVGAMESLGWSALAAFLILSALPLSIGLIGATPSSAKLSVLLETQPVLFMLPYLALLIASYNALSVTLFTLSGSLVRALRRYRKLDPDGQSVFSTRLLVVIIALALAFTPFSLISDPASLLLYALSVGAGCLFLPLLASIWVSAIPGIFVSLAMLSGAGIFALSFSKWSVPVLMHPISAGAIALACGATFLLFGKIWGKLIKRKTPDGQLAELRSPGLRG